MNCAINALKNMLPDADFDQFKPLAAAKNGLSISDAVVAVAEVTDQLRLEVLSLAPITGKEFDLGQGQGNQVLFFVMCEAFGDTHAVCVRSDGGEKVTVLDGEKVQEMELNKFVKIYKPKALAVLATNDADRAVISV